MGLRRRGPIVRVGGLAGIDIDIMLCWLPDTLDVKEKVVFISKRKKSWAYSIYSSSVCRDFYSPRGLLWFRVQ